MIAFPANRGTLQRWSVYDAKREVFLGMFDTEAQAIAHLQAALRHSTIEECSAQGFSVAPVDVTVAAASIPHTSAMYRRQQTLNLAEA